jgi:hypothetical protein
VQKSKNIFRQIVLDFSTAKPSYAYFATQNDIDIEKKSVTGKHLINKKAFNP